MKGYTNGPFPEGSKIVFDLLELQNKAGSLVEGQRRWIGVMEKDTKKYVNTGGWGYENFSGNSKTNRNVPVNDHKLFCLSST
jgi:hypothetical protein